MPRKSSKNSDASSAPGESSSSRPGRRSRKVLPQLSSIPGLMITESDIKKFMAAIEQRGSQNPLHRQTDRFQAGLAMTGILTIQGIYQGVASIVEDRGGVFTVDDLNKLTNSFNRAMASVNQCLKFLGTTGDKREEKPDGDALAKALKRYNIEDETPPGLDEAYISARKEMGRMDGKGDVVDDNHAEEVDIDVLKTPLRGYQEDDDVDNSDNTEIIDVEEVGLDVI